MMVTERHYKIITLGMFVLQFILYNGSDCFGYRRIITTNLSDLLT